MFEENKTTESALRTGRKFIPTSVFNFFQPFYHRLLSLIGAIWYGFPGVRMTIIGVTGTKGKSTTTYFIAKALEEQGVKVAAIGSLGFKINNKEWPNNLHMTMPGRMKLQKFLREARKQGVTHTVIECTSEGMAQGRLAFIPVDTAVFTNLHPEHIERHGTLENYIKAKEYLFKKAKLIHVLNADDQRFKRFRQIGAEVVRIYGMEKGSINQKWRNVQLGIKGKFNIPNALAALTVIDAYGFDINKAQKTIENIKHLDGRMEYIKAYDKQDFDFVVDYAHTPQSYEAVYKELKDDKGKLIAIFGSDGGGRDTWKRPAIGKVASQYCDEIILTSENPYDTDPDEIADDIEEGIEKRNDLIVKRIIDRGEAMREAVRDAKKGDTIVITGKGTEDSIVVAEGKKIPWLDSREAAKAIKEVLSE